MLSDKKRVIFICSFLLFMQDSFTRCFKSNSPEPWNWNIYLFPLWCLGVVVRYGILFPLRYLFFPSIHLALDCNKISSYEQNISSFVVCFSIQRHLFFFFFFEKKIRVKLSNFIYTEAYCQGMKCAKIRSDLRAL
jgi:hypothetical protein